MKIVFIGTGNVAQVLARKFQAAGQAIVQVYGRNKPAAEAMADMVNATACSSWEGITLQADLYVIAISDSALTTATIGLRLSNQLVVHTAGAVPMERLKDISAQYGVLYPFQTIRKEVEPLPPIPFLVDGCSRSVKDRLLELAGTISDKVIIANDTQRMQYHFCAVMTNNFSNYLYVLADDYCNRHGLDFNALLPLIDETAHRLHRFSASQVQTGPAIRKDLTTIQQHLVLLQNEPSLKNLYQLLSDNILAYPWQGSAP